MEFRDSTLRDWFRVVRHELIMGLMLGVTLGVIGLFRAYFMTPAHVLENADGSRTDLLGLTVVVGLAVAAILLSVTAFTLIRISLASRR